MNLSALLDCTDDEPAFRLIAELSAAGSGAVVEATSAVHPLVVASLVAHRPQGVDAFQPCCAGICGRQNDLHASASGQARTPVVFVQ